MVAALRGGVSVEGCAVAGERGWVALAASHGVTVVGVLKYFTAFRIIWGVRAFLADAVDSNQTNNG